MSGLFESSFTIDADIRFDDGQPKDGVIVAYGGRHGGFSLYIRSGNLVLETNDRSRRRYYIRAPVIHRTGELKARYAYTQHPRGAGGTGVLYVDDVLIGSIELPNGIPLSIDNFDIGQDLISPVSDDYDSPFPFMAELVAVTVTTWRNTGR
jgi:arylsulfatase